jgi:hypothetical protein
VKEVFLRSAVLDDLGIEHGFGTRRSEEEAPRELLRAQQVHGACVLRVPPLPEGARADALLTQAPGQAVGVVSADCVPILLAHPSGRAVAAVHAGWRGSAQRIAVAATRALVEAIRCEPSDLVAVLGPHIGPCCYEVDGPVLEALGPEPVFVPSGSPGRYRLDLFELNRRQLLGAGLRAERIGRVPGCTSCDTERFFSYRRDGATGRLTSYIRRPLHP